jgi:hypothetical protein
MPGVAVGLLWGVEYLGLLTPEVWWTVCKLSICVGSYDAGVGGRGCVFRVMWNLRVRFQGNVEP